MAKYIHKKTKIIASNDDNAAGNYKIETPICNFFLPGTIIEESNDWEVVKSYRIMTQTMKHINGPKTIKKIKRTSDDQMFSIGDRAKIKIGSWTDPSGWQYHEGIITGINIGLHENAYLVVGHTCSGSLEEAIFVKTPLFTTEDGVDKFEGNSVYYVNTEFEVKLWKSISNFNPKTRMIFFHGEQAANQYVVYTKEQWSLKQIEATLTKNCSEAFGKLVIDVLNATK